VGYACGEINATRANYTVGISYDIPEERSFQSVWESSPWVNGGERFFFDYYGKMIKFGKKLTKKESHLLSQVLEKRMRKYSKK